MGSSVAEDCQTHGNGDRQHSGPENRHRRRSKQDGPKTSGRSEGEVAERRSNGENDHDAAAGAGSICDVSPEGLHDDAHEREGGQDPTQLRSRQAGVLLEIKAVVWQHDPHRTHVDEPKKRQRHGTKHGAIIASPSVAIS